MANRKTFTTRVTEKTHKMVVAAAKESGRSISQEMELRLEWSLWHDDMEKKLAEKRFA